MGSCSSKTEPQNRLQVLEQRVETLTQMLETSNQTSASAKIKEAKVDPTNITDKDMHSSHLEEQVRELKQQNEMLRAKNLELSHDRNKLEKANKSLKIKIKQIKSLSSQLLAEQHKTQSRIDSQSNTKASTEPNTQTALHAATEKALRLANMELQQQQVAYTAAEAQHAELIRTLERENRELRNRLAAQEKQNPPDDALEDSLEDVDISQSAQLVPHRETHAHRSESNAGDDLARTRRSRPSKTSVRFDISPPPTRRKRVQPTLPQDHTPRGGISFIA